MKSLKNFLSYGVLCYLFLCYCPIFVHAQQESDTLDLSYKKIPLQQYNGASYTISGETLKYLPTLKVTNLLAGIIPGFFSYQTSGGTSDENSSYWIRGSRTNAEGVLLLIDGQQPSLGFISPQEIESITVLKDAVATALYGSRAGNGVILINTKRGKKGKPTVELTAQLTHQTPIEGLKPLDAYGYADHFNEALKYDGADPSNMYTQHYLQTYKNNSGSSEIFPNVNWMDDYVKKHTWEQRYNISVSGGSDRTRYFINGGFVSYDGMFHTDKEAGYSTNNEVKKYNLRSNLEVDVTPTTLLNVDLFGLYDKENMPGGSAYTVFNNMFTTPANAFPPFYQDLGQYADQSGNSLKSLMGKFPAGNGITSNPWSLLNRNGYSTNNIVYGSFRTRLTQNLGFITPGLDAVALLSMDSYTSALTNRQKGYAYYQLVNPLDPHVLRKTNNDVQMANGVSDQVSASRSSLDLQLNYHKKIQQHAFSATGFYNQFENTNQTSIPTRFQTLGAWVGYQYAQKYGIDFTGSYQGSYKFAPGKRFGLFPAVSAGWTVSNEPFFANPLVSYFKLRGSYGRVGNHRDIPAFQYIGRLRTTSAIYNFGNNMGNVNGYVEDIIGNPNLTWEKSTQLNLGMDLKLFNDRLQYVFDYFRDQRSDMYVVNSNITSLFGNLATVSENMGRMETKGYEMALIWTDHAGPLKYTLGGTYSFSENQLLETGEIDQPYPWMKNKGYARGIRRGYQAMGLFSSYEEIAAAPTQSFSELRPGDIRYKDINQDGIIDRQDLVPIGYGNVPDIFYGFNGGLYYRNIGLNIMLQGVSRVTRSLEGAEAFPFLSNGNIYTHQLDYWTPENTNTTLPNISRQNSGVNNSQPSSFWMQDGSYLRLKSVELSYDLSKKILKQSFIKGLRVFASGYNLHVWTGYKSPLDPEPVSVNSMPLTRNISLGSTLRF